VQFESPQARQAFEARVADLRDQGDKPHKERLFAVPFLLFWSHEESLSENAWYNDQLKVCDANHDGRITLQEAWVYNPRFREGMANLAGWNAEQGAGNDAQRPGAANQTPHAELANRNPGPGPGDWAPPAEQSVHWTAPPQGYANPPADSMTRTAYEPPRSGPPMAEAYRR
jgi:hypothetical protein